MGGLKDTWGNSGVPLLLGTPGRADSANPFTTASGQWLALATPPFNLVHNYCFANSRESDVLASSGFGQDHENARTSSSHQLKLCGEVGFSEPSHESSRT